MIEWKSKKCKSILVDVWIAAPENKHRVIYMLDTLQGYVDKVGLCVTISEIRYSYSHGNEKGFRIGLREYPRFPIGEAKLLDHAKNIGRLLAEAGNQGSYMVEQPEGETEWFSRRGDI